MEKQVTLREEKVIVERRKLTTDSTTQDTLTEKAAEMSDTFGVIDAWKSVRDTVRRDEAKIDRGSKQRRLDAGVPRA